MPRTRGVRGRKMKVKGKMTLSEVRKRLMELKIMHQDYIRRKKLISHNDVIMYIEQMNTYKEQFYDHDEILQVIKRLTICFEAIITGEDAEIKHSKKHMSPVYSQIGNIQINTKINDVFDSFGHFENTVSPVYSENEEDKIQTFRVINNISSLGNKKTNEARDICEHSEGSNKETENLNTIGGNSKDYDLNDEYSESILSNYHSNLCITHTVNDKSNKIEVNKPLNDNNIKKTKTTISLAAKDHTVFKKQKILSQAIFSDDEDNDDDNVFNKNTVAKTTNSEICNFSIKRPSQNTSVKKIRKPKKIFEDRFYNETSLYSRDIFSDTNFELINIKKAVEATVNNKSQAIVTRTNENTNDKENNIFNCKSTETLCVQRKNDNKSGKNTLTVDTRILRNRFLINDDGTIIRKPVLEHKNKTLFNENLLTQYSNVDTNSLDHTIGTSNTENINVVLENNVKKGSENFVIPKLADVTKNPKPKKDTNLAVNWITKINNKKDKTNKKHNFELSENSIATSVNTEQKSSTSCDTSIINSYISEAEFSDNRPTKNNEIMNEVDLSWIEKIKSVRIIDEDEYDHRLNNLSDSFWTDSTLPTDCSVSELFD